MQTRNTKRVDCIKWLLWHNTEAICRVLRKQSISLHDRIFRTYEYLYHYRITEEKEEKSKYLRRSLSNPRYSSTYGERNMIFWGTTTPNSQNCSCVTQQQHQQLDSRVGSVRFTSEPVTWYLFCSACCELVRAACAFEFLRCPWAVPGRLLMGKAAAAGLAWGGGVSPVFFFRWLRTATAARDISQERCFHSVYTHGRN